MLFMSLVGIISSIGWFWQIPPSKMAFIAHFLFVLLINTKRKFLEDAFLETVRCVKKLVRYWICFVSICLVNGNRRNLYYLKWNLTFYYCSRSHCHCLPQELINKQNFKNAYIAFISKVVKKTTYKCIHNQII